MIPFRRGRFDALPDAPRVPHPYFATSARTIAVRSERLGEVATHVRVFGAGPPLLLVHGLMTSSYSWRYVLEPLDVLLKGKFVPEPLAGRYRDVVMRIADVAAPLLTRARTQRIHGDLHWGNVIWAADGPILLDFDDCEMGPPVQDVWLLGRGNSPEAQAVREQIIEGYELFREFDRSTLALCEPLRALRIIYMSAWVARRWDDPAFPPAYPAFRSDNYWMNEYEVLFNIADGL